MPQMSPLLWLNLYLYFILLMLIIMMMLYNLNFYMSLKTILNKIYKVSFKMKW